MARSSPRGITARPAATWQVDPVSVSPVRHKKNQFHCFCLEVLLATARRASRWPQFIRPVLPWPFTCRRPHDYTMCGLRKAHPPYHEASSDLMGLLLHLLLPRTSYLDPDLDTISGNLFPDPTAFAPEETQIASRRHCQALIVSPTLATPHEPLGCQRPSLDNLEHPQSTPTPPATTLLLLRSS